MTVVEIELDAPRVSVAPAPLVLPVPVRPRRRPLRHWPWALALVALIAYLAFGYWLVFGADYVIGDAFSRAASSRSIAHSRDQHLMGVGFYWMPLPTFSQAPFMAVFSRLGHPQLAIPAGTALAGALTIPALVRAGRTLGLRDRTTFVVVLIYAFNPYTLFFAASGMSEAWAALFLAWAVTSYLEWCLHRKNRRLGAFGIYLAFALLSKYEVLACLPLFGIVIAAQVRRGRRLSSAGVALLPAIFTFFVWSVVALVITGKNPFQLVFGGAAGQKLENIGWLPDERTPITSFEYVLKMSALVAPGFLVLLLASGFLPELIAATRSLVRRSLPASGLRLPALGAALPFAVFPGQVAYLLLNFSTFGNPRYFTPLLLSFTFLSLITLARVRGLPPRAGDEAVREVRRRRTVAGGVTLVFLVGLGATNAITDVATLSNPRASKIEHEDFWMDLLSGESVEVDTSLTRWRQFTSELDAKLTSDDLVAVDSGVAFPFTLLTSHPKQVALDRDKDSERLTSRNPVQFTWIIYVDDVVSQSVMNSALKDALNRAPRGMTWVLDMKGPTKEFWLGNVEVYRLVPTGSPQEQQTTPQTQPETPGS